MSLLHALELEERVGQIWHRMVGERASWPRHPEAAVTLDEVRGPLAVLFRGLGGDKGVQIAAATARTSGHRLSWRQRVGMDDERLIQARRDDSTVALPPMVDVFPDSRLNRDLYVWLAAFFAVLPPPTAAATDPLQADLERLRCAARATATVLAAFPGLALNHAALCRALRAVRPRRSLKGVEAEVEAMVLNLLGGASAPSPRASHAPADYRPFLPVPLWGEALRGGLAVSPAQAEPIEPPAGGSEDGGEARRLAERQRHDNADRKDPLILNRFEKILAFADMVNVNRDADDTDADQARKAADDMDTLSLVQHSKKAATRLKFDLDLPPEATDPARLTGALLYPEWDYRKGAYHPDHCSVLVARAAEDGEDWHPDEAGKRRIRMVRRQFEALRTRPVILRAQIDGNDLDTEQVVRSFSDLAAGGAGSERVYTQRRATERDLSVAVLVDASLSTDAWIDNRRVLDVEKEALAVFGHGLAACGDPFAVYAFTSRKRTWVKIDTVKDFDEPFGAPVMRRIGALKPGYYTRIGTAIRHSTARLEQRPNRHRLLLVLTDGKPNDVDHYEGRYGIEDTRKAIIEARAKGLVVFGVTVDRKAQSYFPHLFGRGSFAIVQHLAQLSGALPRLYRHLVAA